MQELNPPPQIARRDAERGAGIIPARWIAVALLCCAVALAGWSLDSHMIAGFGDTLCLMQPLTAIGHVFTSLALIASIAGRPRPAIAMLGIPFVIVAVTLFQDVTGRSLGIDTLLFADSVTRQVGVIPGRPGPTTVATLLLLALATLASISAERGRSRLGVMIASVALGIAAVSGAAMPLGLVLSDSTHHYILTSPPAAISTAALAIAIIAWRHHSGWPGLFLAHGSDGRTLKAIMALCLLAPIGFTMIRLWVVRNAIIPTEFAEILNTGAQLIVAYVALFWAWSRITWANAARWTITHALDSAPIVIANIDGKVLHWSKGCERLYGWSAKEAIGRRKHILLRVDEPCRWAGVARRLAAGPACEDEIVEYHRDGTPIHILENARLLEDGDGRDPMIVLSMTDITERKRAEEALRASDARLALAVEAHEIGIFEWDAASDALLLSPDAERLVGLVPSSFQGGLEQWRTYLRATFSGEILPEEQEVIDRKLPRFGFSMRSRQGHRPQRTIEGSGRCIYAPDGRLVTVIGVMFDTTEREQRAAALEAREAELRSILETVPDTMITICERGRIRSFSATAEQLFGYRAADVIGHDVTLLMSEPFRQEHAPALARYLESGEAYFVGRGRTLTARHRDGTEIPIELAVGEAHVGRERIFIGFVRNLSERLAAEARLAELRDQLLHASRLSAMGEIAAGLAHELNQPLAATTNFLGAADMLLSDDGAGPGQVRDLVRLAAGQTLRAGDIIRRVRTFLSKGEVERSVEPVKGIITDSVHLVLAGAERQQVNICYDLDPRHPLILADRVQIQQVLVNLIRNALEALRERPGIDPEIVLASRGSEGGMVEIMVRDNGPGIARQIIERPYEPFVSTKRHGMGVGLSICRRIIEAHGGTFLAENRPEGGAMIRFTVPAMAETELGAG